MVSPDKLRARIAAGKGELLAQQLAANRVFRENETTEDAPMPRHIIAIEDVTHGLGLDAADEQEVQRIILDTNAHFDQTTQTHRLTLARASFVTTLRAMPHISSDIRMELTKRAIAYWRRNTQTDYGKPPTVRTIAVKSEPTLVIKASQKLNGDEKRVEMPQIVAKKLPAFLKELREDGAKCSRKSYDANKLKPMQNKLDTSKVERLKNTPEALKKPIVVSQDHFILDGHHRWAACDALGQKVPCVEVALDKDELLEQARDFDGAEFRKAGGDKIPGGLASGKKPSDFDKAKLEAGIKVELEHTSDRAIAAEIAMDHLTEDPNYYEKLETIEKASRPPAGYVPAPGSKKGAYRKKVAGKWDHWYPDAKKPARKAKAKKKKPAREPHINGWAGVVSSELGDHLRGILVRYGNLEALQQELKETLDPEKQKEAVQGIANYKVNEMTGIPSKAETQKLLEQSMKLRTFDDVQKFTETVVDLGDHKIQVINLLGNSLGWAIRAPGAPPKKGDDGYARHQKLVKKAKAFEQDTSWRRPKSTDPQEVADTYNLAMIDINPTLPEPIQTHITGMLSNAFEDLADVLGAVKLSHGSLQIRVTAQEALYAPGYAYGAQYVRPRSRNPQDWDRDWNFGGEEATPSMGSHGLQEKMDQAPPMIRISMERASALAHEYGHALDDATSIISATPAMREQHADEIAAKEAVHMLLLKSPMRDRAERVERKTGPRGYWGSPAEMWARGFEQYVHKKMNDKGRFNSLLTHHTYDGRVDDGVFMAPKEFAPIEAAFDKWLGMVKELGMLEKAFRLLFGEPTLIVKARTTLTPNIQVGESRGAPRFDTPPIPDYQSIYYPPENADSHKREREQSQNRRRADAERVRGKWGFHGKVLPDKPVIRWKLDREESEDPFEHTGVKQEHKPRKSPKLMARDRLKAGVTTYPEEGTELPGDGKRKRKRKKKKKQVRLTARKQ